MLPETKGMKLEDVQQIFMVKEHNDKKQYEGIMITKQKDQRNGAIHIEHSANTETCE